MWDQVFWVLLRRVWSRWEEVLVVVNSETVVRWHPAGFRLYWLIFCSPLCYQSVFTQS